MALLHCYCYRYCYRYRNRNRSTDAVPGKVHTVLTGSVEYKMIDNAVYDTSPYIHKLFLHTDVLADQIYHTLWFSIIRTCTPTCTCPPLNNGGGHVHAQRIETNFVSILGAYQVACLPVDRFT